MAIKAGGFPAHHQKMTGFVVGFSGSKIFCLHVYNMTTIEVPLSSPMFQYLDSHDLKMAYTIACLGVTEGDWDYLGRQALEALDLSIAKKAFIRLKDLRHLEFINDLEQRKNRDEDQVLLGDIAAFQGRFAEAAKLYKKCGQESRALTMYTDLRMFDLANEYLGKYIVKCLMNKMSRESSNAFFM